jgi:RNA polymerase sigma-70 factor (ECF subfamily)
MAGAAFLWLASPGRAARGVIRVRRAAIAADDQSLVALARRGDTEAFGDLVSRHERAMLAVARAYFASEADAEDAVQDALVKAFRCLDQLRDGSRFSGWLTRITVNTCLDTLRSRTDKRSLADFATSIPLHPRLGQERFTPATLASRSERSERLRAAIGRLPEDQRVVVMLRYGEDMSYDQVADYLDVPPSTVQGRLRRAKRALKAVLSGRDAIKEG